MGIIKIRFLVPMVIFFSVPADASLRFVPPQRIAFRAWEAAGLSPTAEGPFTPNMVYQNDRSYGDSQISGNAPSRRVYRQEHFTTDAFGFRNTSAAENRPIKFIVVGDSYAAGSAVSDSETLSSQLAEMSQTGAITPAATTVGLTSNNS